MRGLVWVVAAGAAWALLYALTLVFSVWIVLVLLVAAVAWAVYELEGGHDA